MSGESKGSDKAKVWGAVATTAAAVSAIAALVMLIFLNITWRTEIESGRPYLIIKEDAGIVRLENGSLYQVVIPLENIGERAACEVVVGFYMIDKNMVDNGLICDPLFDGSCALANELPPEVPTPGETHPFTLEDDMSPHYVVVAVKYMDLITEKSYCRVLFMTWGGVDNGVVDGTFEHATAEEKVTVEGYLQDWLKDFR